MYLHSMRREIYVIIRDLDVHNLFVVRVKTGLSIALLRNSVRSESTTVNEETINNIFHQFEEPNYKLVYEKLNGVIDTTDEIRWDNLNSVRIMMIFFSFRADWIFLLFFFPFFSIFFFSYFDSFVHYGLIIIHSYLCTFFFLVQIMEYWKL